MMRIKAGLTMVLASALSACVTTAPAPRADLNNALARMMAGESAMSGAALDRALAKAAVFPLGTKDNPVRATGPMGQRTYLARLRCADGAAPGFYRQGNAGVGIYGNIVDIYDVTCAGSTPARTAVWMDMYHKGHIESRAVPGFTIDRGPTT